MPTIDELFPPQVRTTNDYSRFSFAPGNRPVPATLSELGRSVDEMDLLAYFPIVVCRHRGKYYILDGQHRYTLCRDRGLPVHFIVTPIEHSDIPNVAATINCAHRKWTMMDYLLAWCSCPDESKREIYETVKEVWEPSGLSLSITISLLYYGRVRVGGMEIAGVKHSDSGEVFKKGDMRILHPEKAKKVIALCQSMKPFPYWKDRKVVSCIAFLVEQPEFDRTQFKRKAALKTPHKSILKATLNIPDTMTMLDRLYNYREDNYVSLSAIAELAKRAAIKKSRAAKAAKRKAAAK